MLKAKKPFRPKRGPFGFFGTVKLRVYPKENPWRCSEVLLFLLSEAPTRVVPELFNLFLENFRKFTFFSITEQYRSFLNEASVMSSTDI